MLRMLRLHPQYLSAMTYQGPTTHRKSKHGSVMESSFDPKVDVQGLLMDKEERSWTIWQPPVLLVLLAEIVSLESTT